jgi:hypothetical protein
MSAVNSTKPTAQPEGRTGRKKKVKTEAAAANSNAGSSTPPEGALRSLSLDDQANGTESKSYESPYIKELHKSVVELFWQQHNTQRLTKWLIGLSVTSIRSW